MHISIRLPMLKTFSRFTSSFAALLTEQNTVIDLGGRVGVIREAMLDLLMEMDANEATKTWQDVDRAHDAQSLWYLRSDLSRLLGEHLGEQDARIKMDRLTEMFRGVVPKNQMPVTRSFKR